MKFLSNLLKDKKTLLSIVLGLALAWFFYKATCAGGQCLVIGKKAPVGGVPKVQMDVDGKCYRFDKFNTYCQFPIPEGHTDFIPGGSYQDPGYWQSEGADVIQYGKHGSMGALYEGYGKWSAWKEEDKCKCEKEGDKCGADGTATCKCENDKCECGDPMCATDGKEKFTATCLGMDPLGTEYPSSPFFQVACRPEPKWNLPRDARVFHQAMYPCGVPGQCNASKCYKHHPMDSIYAPPNEGIMTRQVRN